MPTNTYVALDKVTVGTATPSITFTGISQAYTDLVLVMSVRSTDNGDGDDVKGTFNSDTSSNYSWTQIYGTGSSAASNRGSAQSFMKLGIYAGNATTAGTFSSCVTHIQNYSNTTTYKTNLVRRDIATQYTVGVANMWRSTAAITSITLTPAVGNFAVGSTFSLYGIAAEAISPAPKATGGAIYSDSTYYYHVFGSTGTFTPLQSLTADYLVIAGGGGSTIGGGGAGGLRSTVGATGGGGSLETALSLSATAYTVTVGAGGAGGSTSVNTRGGNGTNSVFSTITSTGGGGGAAGNGAGSWNNGLSGGSGGGCHYTGTAGAGTANQGYAGGTSADGGTGSGGGGAGAVGGSFSGTVGGVGGAGVSISAMATATGTGVLNYYAGGGGGFGSGTSVGGAGGGGGGSNLNGVAFTGSGGGANASIAQSGNGGSGVVIVRYAKA